MSTPIQDIANVGTEIQPISVPINFDIIRLFSEGLYRSPHKAIEELVSNGYDANAQCVHVLLPEDSESESMLWVIDDGHGMNADGFCQLWRVADSNKNGAIPPSGRAPIGQFGIGKLAAYVLAWHLTHISRVNGKLLLTTMNFHDVCGRQNDATDPIQVSLREIDEDTAKSLLGEIERRDPDAWQFMFDPDSRVETWTAAGLHEFKELHKKLSTGRLHWVLSTGLPLHADFQMWLNGSLIPSSKERLDAIKTISLKEDIDGIGTVEGTASVYEKVLTDGKSERIGRSHGFFIRVRERVINLEDELFGISQPNHAAWSRFSLEVNADGLRNYLLSSREGVRDSAQIEELREWLKSIFNQCRNAYEEWSEKNNRSLDITALLAENPSAYVIEPLVHSVQSAVHSGRESFYIESPGEDAENDMDEWLERYEKEASEKPFNKTQFVAHGPNAPTLLYDPSSRNLKVNKDHPYVAKLSGGGNQRNSAKLFAVAEVLLEGQLQDHGVDPITIASFLSERDRCLRLAAGETPPDVHQIIRLLESANEDSEYLERSVGAVFQALGFKYERKGGNESGPDGILYACLGRQDEGLADYSVVYDAKQTDKSTVPADKVDFASLENFRESNNAKFGFFTAIAYAGERDVNSTVNKKQRSSGTPSTLLKLEHLKRLIWLHYLYGITLKDIRALFEGAHTVLEVDEWLDVLEKSLAEVDIPLDILLQGIEEMKLDEKSIPNIHAVREKYSELKQFDPDRLIARLVAVQTIVGERWIKVDEISGKVQINQSTEQILTQLDHNVRSLQKDESERAS